jgi:hypothetical protein
MLLRVIAVYSENLMRHINTLCGQNSELFIVKASGTCRYQWALIGWPGRDADHSPPSNAEVKNE